VISETQTSNGWTQYPNRTADNPRFYGQKAKASAPDAQTKIVAAQAVIATDVPAIHKGTLQPPPFNVLMR